MKKVVVGSRESKLAVVQSELVIDAIKKHDSSIEIELVTMKTTGDIILDRTLDKVGGKGLFVKELDSALMENRVDITVHSLKDMPAIISDEMPIVALSTREDPRDVLILAQGATELDVTKPIGCASKRRELQLRDIYPDMAVKPIRGNVQTRLAKLDSGEYSAIVLAYAGIKRLGLEHRISRVFSVDEILPAACQGIIAVQAKKGADTSFLQGFACEDTHTIATAERAFIRTLDGGCSSPVAAYATISGGDITLTGFYVDEDGVGHKKAVTAHKADAVKLGEKLAIDMKNEFSLSSK